MYTSFFGSKACSISQFSPRVSSTQGKWKQNEEKGSETNNADPRCTSMNQEGAKMYIMTLRSLKSTKQMQCILKKQF